MRTTDAQAALAELGRRIVEAATLAVRMHRSVHGVDVEDLYGQRAMTGGAGPGPFTDDRLPPAAPVPRRGRLDQFFGAEHFRVCPAAWRR